MKRRLGIFAASAMLATLGVFAPASPASAHTDACTGEGTATLSTGFGLPGTVNSAAFSFTFTAGACVNKGLQTGATFATGTVTGACGLSTGSGTTVSGHSFSFVSTGTVLALTGQVSGTVTAVSDPTAGSCTNKTATRFFIQGAVTKQHCTISQSLTTVPLPTPPWGPGASATTHTCVG